MSYASEAALVADFLDQLGQGLRDNPWTVYPETAGWDLLMVHSAGHQLGLEAKLSLNAKVIDQALSGQHRYWNPAGPDYRGVLVPAGKCQAHLRNICAAIGIGIVEVRPREARVRQYFSLPIELWHESAWQSWMPGERCPLPDYIPDVEAGKKSPVALTEWKIKAIKLMIVLERRGHVTRRDMAALKISASRFTDAWHGFLARTPQGYVRCGRTPDLRAQHPRNFAEIEADAETWAALAGIDLAAPADLFAGAAA
jgi:hypothetical protein